MLQNLPQLLTQIFFGLLGLSFLVLIHEGGHFIAAKKFGVKVRTFAIGFGKTLLSFKKGDTEYCLKAIPFGGYVAMEGEQPEDQKWGNSDEFASKPIYQRMIIALGGPLVNLIFAFIVLVGLYMWGIQEPKSNFLPIGQVEENSPAFKAGVTKQDTLTHIMGREVNGIEDFLSTLAPRANKITPLTLNKNGISRTVEITPQMHSMGFAYTGIIPGQYFVQAAQALSGSPSEKAGFKKGDKILEVQGVKVVDNESFIKMIQSSKGATLSILVERDSIHKTLSVTPQPGEDSIYRIGLSIQPVYHTPTHVVKRSFIESVEKSWQTNVRLSKTVFVVLGNLFTGQIQLKALSGPVGILQVIGSSARKSIEDFIYFLALISLNLGLMNLLPLIITDGGIILFLLLEAIRGKPLSQLTQQRINQVAVALFITLALFITFHDIKRIPLFLE